jgi:hypothetical protein
VKIKVYRDARSGEYVSEEYAAANPDTTVSETETVEDPKPKKKTAAKKAAKKRS